MLHVVVEEPGRGGDVVKGDVERRQLPCSMPTVSGTTFFSDGKHFRTQTRRTAGEIQSRITVVFFIIVLSRSCRILFFPFSWFSKPTSLGPTSPPGIGDLPLDGMWHLKGSRKRQLYVCSVSSRSQTSQSLLRSRWFHSLQVDYKTQPTFSL